MSTVLEVIFRRLFQFLLLLIALPMVGAAIGYILAPHSYQVTASLWALRRYEIIGATGTESDLQSTPAETQATALTELLKTRVFDLAVAKQTGLAATLSPDVQADQQKRDDALFNEIAQHVQVTSLQYNLFSISYSNRNPTLAQEVVKGVINSYGLQSQSFTTITGQSELNAYTTQLANAQKEANAAAQAEQQYRRAHPTLTQSDLLNDAQYVLLHAQTQQAQSIVSNIQNQIAMIKQEINLVGSGNNSLYKVLDAPMVPDSAQSRLKTVLSGAGAGLAVALLAIVLSVIVFVRRDHPIYTLKDLQKIASQEIVMQVPALDSATAQSMLKEQL